MERRRRPSGRNLVKANVMRVRLRSASEGAFRQADTCYDSVDADKSSPIIQEAVTEQQVQSEPLSIGVFADLSHPIREEKIPVR